MGAARWLRIGIKGILGIPDTQLEFRTGGVNVVQGRNGAGKTRLLMALARALGDEDALVEASPDSPTGTMDIAALSGQQQLLVSQAGRVRTKGAAPIEAQDMGAVSDLIRGAHNGSVRIGDKPIEEARQRAFVRIARPVIDETAIEALCERDTDLMEFLREKVKAGVVQDLLKAAEVVQDRLQALAREREGIADGFAGANRAHNGDASAEEMKLAGLGVSLLSAPDVKAAEAAVRIKAALEGEARRTCGERVAMEQRQAEIRAASTPRPDALKATESFMDKLKEARLEKANGVQLREDLARLQERIVASDKRFADLDSVGRQLEQESRDITAQAEQWDAQQKILLATPAGASGEEVAKAEAATKAAEELAEAHRISSRVIELRKQAEQASLDGQNAAAKAKELRESSAAVRERISDILSRQGAAGFSMVNGKLAFAVGGREPIEYDSLSLGEKTFAALNLQLSSPGFSGWCWLDEPFYSALDFAHKEQLAGWAETHPEVLLATEQPTEGPASVRFEGGVV